MGEILRPLDGDLGFATTQIPEQDNTERRRAAQELRDSEDRLRLILESTAEAIYGTDLEGRCTFCNPACLRLLGYEHCDELLGKNMHDIVHHSRPDGTKLPLEECRVLRAFKKGEGVHFADEVLWKADGTCFPVELWSYPQRKGNDIVGAVVTFIDIAERKVAEKALRESEERFQSAFEHAGVGMALVDSNGRWLQVNPALCDFLGYASDELLATNFQAITDPNDLPADVESLHRVLDGTLKVYQREKRYLHKQGHAVWGLLTAWPVLNAEGKPIGSVAQIQNISKRKQAEDALRTAHAESELFINSVPSILIGTDDKGQITRWNLAASNTFNLPASAVRGKSLKDCGIRWISPNIEAEIDSWLRILKGGRRCDLLFEKDGERHFLGLSVNRVTFGQAKSAGLLITGVDITERRHLEEQLRQAQKLEAIGQLAAGIAHEINTPTQYVGDNLTFIKQSAQDIANLGLAAQQLNEESKLGAISPKTIEWLHRTVDAMDLGYLLLEIPKAIDQSLEGVRRVAKIVHAMKEFSHPGSEEKTAIDINRAIETTITVARNEWKYVSEVETCFDSDLPLVQCHAGEFNQVILNLLINAAHAIRQVVGDGSDGKGKIRVATDHKGNWVEIAIQDTGCGIPEAIQSRIFEPFFTTKPVGQGTGQGLALAHTTIVRRHGGRLWFESIEGKGTTFFIRLPITASTTDS